MFLVDGPSIRGSMNPERLAYPMYAQLMRVADLTATCVETLIQGQGCSLGYEYTELIRNGIILWKSYYLSKDKSQSRSCAYDL